MPTFYALRSAGSADQQQEQEPKQRQEEAEQSKEPQPGSSRSKSAGVSATTAFVGKPSFLPPLERYNCKNYPQVFLENFEIYCQHFKVESNKELMCAFGVFWMQMH